MAKAKRNIPLWVFGFLKAGVWAVTVVKAFYRVCLMQLDGIPTFAAGVLAIEVAITSLM